MEETASWKLRPASFNAKLQLEWGPTSIDTSYPGFSGTIDRRYAQNGFGVARTSYRAT